MARFSRRQLVTALSTLYLTALTAIAAYALHQANHFSLPISNIQAALTVALPPLAGVALETIITFQHERAAKGRLQTSRIFQALNAAFLIFETVLATIAGTHIAPLGGLMCPLQERWHELFSGKNARDIQRIQDAFNCCGFNSPRDMAFPWPSNNAHGSEACMIRYDRSARCLEPWRVEERKVAIMLLVVPIAVFAWKLVLFLLPGSNAALLPSAINLPTDNPGSRPAIGYHDGEDEAEEDGVRGEVRRLNRDSNLASHIERNRTPLIQDRENNFWASN